MSTVRIAVAGLGRMGRIHADTLTRLPGAELAGVVDASGEIAREAGERFDVPWSTEYGTLLRDWAADAVIVAAPTPLHAPMIEAAAAAGKHVLCEKPLAQTDAQAASALAAVARSGVKVQVGFHRRFDPDWTELSARLRAGDAGAVILFRASLRDRCAPGAEYLRRSGGLFMDVAIHELDAARWLVGEIVEVTAVGSEAAGPDDLTTAVVVLRFGNGALGVIDASRTAGYGYEASVEVMGTRATLRLANDRATHVETLDARGAVRDWVQDWATRHRDAYRLEVEAFAGAIRHDTEPVVTAEDAMAAAVLAQACAISLAERRAVRVTHQDAGDGVAYHIVAGNAQDDEKCVIRNIDQSIVA